MGGSDLRGNFKPQGFLDLGQPLQGRLANSLKTAGMRAGFPYPRTEDVRSYLLHCPRNLKHLLTAFCAARSRYQQFIHFP